MGPAARKAARFRTADEHDPQVKEFRKWRENLVKLAVFFGLVVLVTGLPSARQRRAPRPPIPQPEEPAATGPVTTSGSH